MVGLGIRKTFFFVLHRTLMRPLMIGSCPVLQWSTRKKTEDVWMKAFGKTGYNALDLI